MPWKSKCLVATFLLMLVGNIWRKVLIDLAKSAKILCEAWNYGAIPDLFLGLICSKMEQMKSIATMKK